MVFIDLHFLLHVIFIIKGKDYDCLDYLYADLYFIDY